MLFTEYAGGTLSAERFVEQAGSFLSNVQAHAADLLALWIEDGSGRILAASDPRGAVAELSRAERPAVDPEAEGWLAVPPRRTAGTYVVVFCGPVRDAAGRMLGSVLLAADFGPVMTFLGDTRGLGESGEVLVGWKSGDRIHLPFPPRGDVNLSEVSGEEFPSLNAASSGEFGFRRTTDYRGRDVLVAYRPLGVGYPNWGLIAKIDFARGLRAGRAGFAGCCWPWAGSCSSSGSGHPTRSPGGSPGRSAGWPGRRRPSPRAT